MIQAHFFRLIHALFILSCVLTSNLVFAKPALWTKQSARFELINSRPGNNLNWVFLPGGPGLGSEYLREFSLSLKLPGSTWLLDMPGDGSNQSAGKSLDYSQWPQDLAKAVSSLDNVVLVAHSYGGMLALSSPELLNHLSGLILIDTAPNNQWMHSSAGSCSNCDIPKTNPTMTNYDKNPSDLGLKQVALSMGPLFFSPDQIKEGTRLLENLPYNHLPYDWVNKHFNPSYQAKWIPQTIPTLIISGTADILTPISLFQQDKRFNRPNIKTILIPHAGHFSWINHQSEFKTIFNDFAGKVSVSLTPASQH